MSDPTVPPPIVPNPDQPAPTNPQPVVPPNPDLPEPVIPEPLPASEARPSTGAGHRRLGRRYDTGWVTRGRGAAGLDGDEGGAQLVGAGLAPGVPTGRATPSTTSVPTDATTAAVPVRASSAPGRAIHSTHVGDGDVALVDAPTERRRRRAAASPA